LTSTRQHQNHPAIYDYLAQKRKFPQPLHRRHKITRKNLTLMWKASAKSTGRPPIKGALAQREENHARAFTAITKFGFIYFLTSLVAAPA